LQFELARILWPLYVYSYLDLVDDMFTQDAIEFFQKFKWMHEKIHADELHQLETVTLKAHVAENSIAKLYRENKYRIPLNIHIYHNLFAFLESKGNDGGLVTRILGKYCQVIETSRGPIDQYSFEAIIARTKGTDIDEIVEVQEGIPGGFTGVSNQDLANNGQPVRLGPLQTEPDLVEDTRAELQEHDAKNPPAPGQPTLSELYEAKIKREESADAIPRNEIPLPPSRAKDVVMEVQKIKENRDRFKIEGRTGGVGPAVSVCMFTFHNTLDTVTCIEFSDDNNLVAVGTEESYIPEVHTPIWPQRPATIVLSPPDRPLRIRLCRLLLPLYRGPRRRKQGHAVHCTKPSVVMQRR
jgi:transcription initiation factor TFIID subunit 5